MLKRTEESWLTNWYFEIDRHLLWAVVILAFVGMWAMVAAGSVAAERMNPPQPWHFFFVKMLPFYLFGFITLIVSSALSSKWVMRVAWLNVAFCLLLLMVTLVHPMVIKGSSRWVNLFGFSVMPGDLMKPGFIILTAWFLTRMKKITAGADMFVSRRAWRWDGWPMYLAVFAPALLIILRHPDVGTAMLYLFVLSGMIFVAGLPMYFIPIFGGIAAIGGIFAFLTMGHFRGRVLTFLGFSGGSDNFQVQKSVEAIRHGGLFGSGESSFIKQSLPEAHTDAIYSAIAEDSGAILAALLIVGFLYILKRVAVNARSARDQFVFYVASGMFALLGIQVTINLASTLGMMPPKGMTLPLISYGGSSFVSFCLLFGLLIALVREDKWK
ncbi:MAG: FtsW/RodA/SpoVE family cell cycle protein [Alphaproteobacteria bacterium]|nr:FtsW/RodA/SpoVE family cell cycle protein [Alphaproteobacteria bacterium]MCL2889795.1 FtsW/RodA/SpoVE family cell cycle protein [Alphaproteobacteria bacterium]